MSNLIYKQIAEIMAEIPSIGKDRNAGSGGFSYKFRGIDEVYNALHPLLAKHKVFPTPEVLEVEREWVTTKNDKKQLHTKVLVKYTFYAEDGSNVSCVTIGEGMDPGDKSGNKAMSGAEKYAFFQIFCIPTDEPKDSENDSPEVTGTLSEAQMARAKEIAEDIKKATALPHLTNKMKGFADEIAKMPEAIQKRLEATRSLVEGELTAKFKAEKEAAESAPDPDKDALEQDLQRGDGQGSMLPDDTTTEPEG